MKATRSYLMVVSLVAGGLCLANLVSLTGFFRALETSGGAQGSDKQMQSQLQNLHSQIAATDDREIIKRQIRTFEASIGSGINEEKLKQFRKEFGPVISVFASKPKEAESRFLLIKKRELMENLVNAYRKEIPSGKIPVRAAYLNILFDTQNSLLNESDETEQVYVRRNKDRFTSLRALIGGDQGLAARLNNLEGIFQAIDKGLEQGIQWRQQKSEALAKVEKSIPKLSRELQGASDGQMEDLRRFFLYCCIFALTAGIAAYITFYLAHKVLKLKFYQRTDSFLRILKEFGRDRLDPGHERELRVLREDPDWVGLTDGMMEAEAEFIGKYQTLLAVPKSMSTPYAVIGKNRILRQWNKAAEDLFGLREKSEGSLDDLICEKKISPRAGAASALVDLIRNSFVSLDTDTFELMIKNGNAWEPYELLSFPIMTGPLAGGRVYFFREIRNETERVNKAVTTQLARVRASVQQLCTGGTAEFVTERTDAPAVQETLKDLQSLKRKNDEREILWKSETSAVLDQVERQKEILQRLTAELNEIRDAHRNALELVSSIHGEDEDWHKEVCSMQAEMERWKIIRARLESDLTNQAGILSKAKSYEGKVRHSAEEMDQFLSGYDGILAELVAFTEEAKVHSVNMGFVKDPASREFAARSRAFTHEISRFVDQAGRLSTKVRAFLSDHPANSLAPYLESTDMDPAVLKSLRQEEERLGAYVERWRSAGEEIVAGGEKALGLLREADKKSALISQLGETSILINEQAKGNLERWN